MLAMIGNRCAVVAGSRTRKENWRMRNNFSLSQKARDSVGDIGDIIEPIGEHLGPTQQTSSPLPRLLLLSDWPKLGAGHNDEGCAPSLGGPIHVMVTMNDAGADGLTLDISDSVVDEYSGHLGNCECKHNGMRILAGCAKSIT
jgi:hypothetical protein